MELEKAKEVFTILKDLPGEDYSETRFGEEELDDSYNIVDFWKAKGKKLKITTNFTDNVDLSYSEIDEVILVGRFNRVDATEAKIAILDIRDAVIIKLDLTEAEIGEVKRNK